MHCREWTKSIKGVDDVELNIPRLSPLAYHCAAPASGKAAGLVFVIPDLGEDIAGEAQRGLRAHLATAHRLLAVGVEYHCLRTRVSDGAQFDFNPREMDALRFLAMKHGHALLDPKAVFPLLAKLPVAYEFEVRVIPSNGEYQNLGVMQALDHLAVLRDLHSDCDIRFDEENIIAMGGAYGGYLAHLVAKFAPNTLRAVFDFGSMTQAPRSYLFGGDGLAAAPYYYFAGKCRIFPLIATRWSAEQGASNFYSPARQSIRDVAVQAHVQTACASLKRHCQYRLVNAASEGSESHEGKIRQAGILAEAGFDVLLEHDKGDSDGEASYDVSAAGYAAKLGAIFDRLYLALAPNPGKPDFMLGTSLAYWCESAIYGFEHGAWGCNVDITHFSAESEDNPSYKAQVVSPRFEMK